MSAFLEIARDEAGHTGSDLLEPNQRFFGFGSVAVGDAEAFEIIVKARSDHPVQMPELKAAKLMATARGRALIADVLDAREGRYVANVHDKLLALCGWFFEYIYEPVYQDDPGCSTKRISTGSSPCSVTWINEASGDGRIVIEQFQNCMRSLDPADAPYLFDRPMPPLSVDGDEYPFESVLRFAHGYRDVIAADNARLRTVMPDKGRWTLDLSTSSLWSHLNHWGARGKPLSVTCDASKPLLSFASAFKGDDTDPGIRRARQKGHSGPLGWKLLEPIRFVDSRNHPSVQLADIVAGTIVAVSVNGVPEDGEAIGENLRRHVLDDSILPDMDVIDLKNRSAADPPIRSPSQWPGTARSSTDAGLSLMDTAFFICPSPFRFRLACLERRIVRLALRCSRSSFFSTPRA
jgi:Protein of unknown function (DUF3800)